jgi:hypothetical protein
MDFGPEDERLLATLFPEDPSLGTVVVGAPSSSSSYSPDWVTVVAVIVGLVVAVVGVELAFKRVRGSGTTTFPPWLQGSKVVAGLICFYVAYWSLRASTQ